MPSPQSLSEAERRTVAAWAADCAEHVLPIFEAEAPDDDRPRALVERTRAYARGELSTADEIRRRFVGAVGPGEVTAPAAAAAARAAGQAVAVCHMGAHALGAAAYAARAVGLAQPDRPEAAEEELRWQLDHMPAEVGEALRKLPAAGRDRSGPLGPGLLTSGPVGEILRELQARLATTVADQDDQRALRRALVRMAVDQQRPEELPDVAARALAEGVDSPGLRELAGLSNNDPRQARDLFALAIEQLGIEAPASRWDAARLWASEIIDGTLSPYQGARLIWWHCWEALGRPDELTPFVGLASEWEDDPGRRRLYETDIIIEARRLVRRPS